MIALHFASIKAAIYFMYVHDVVVVRPSSGEKELANFKGLMTMTQNDRVCCPPELPPMTLWPPFVFFAQLVEHVEVIFILQ